MKNAIATILCLLSLPLTTLASGTRLTALDCERAGGWAHYPRSEYRIYLCVDGKLHGRELSQTEVCPVGGVTTQECEDYGGYAFRSHGEKPIKFCVDGVLNECAIND